MLIIMFSWCIITCNYESLSFRQFRTGAAPLPQSAMLHHHVSAEAQNGQTKTLAL